MLQIRHFIQQLFSLLSLVWPPNAIRIIYLGAERIAEFRAYYGREPTDAEWREISIQVGKEVTGRD
jgi:hypothetical protein